MRETLLAQLAACATSAGGAMMAISDVEQRNLTERFDKPDKIWNAPHRMLNAVLGGEVEQRFSHGYFHNHRVQIATRSVREKDRTSLCSQHHHVMSAIILF